jgi:hypothetical protein
MNAGERKSMWVWTIAMLAMLQPSHLVFADSAEGHPSTTQAASQGQAKVEMIFWENQIWKPGGGGERLTLWADGRSEIRVRRFGDPRKPRAGWTVSTTRPFTFYVKTNPVPVDEAIRRFNGALAAGIALLKSFPPGYTDGGGTQVGIQTDGQLKEITIPEFIHPDQKDNQGSENHKRFLAVQQVIDGFDTDAVEP